MQSRCRTILLLIIAAYAASCAAVLRGHEGHHHASPPSPSAKSGTTKQSDHQEAETYFRFFSSLVARWPTTLKDSLIEQAFNEQRFANDHPAGPKLSALKKQRDSVLDRLGASLRTLRVDITPDGIQENGESGALQLCPSISTTVLIVVRNRTEDYLDLRAVAQPPFSHAAADMPHTRIAAGATIPLLTEVQVSGDTAAVDHVVIELESEEKPARDRTIRLPVRLVPAAKIVGTLLDSSGSPIPGRVTIDCSDGLCRYGGKYATKSTFTDKPVILPQIRTWQKLPFFYCDGSFEIDVPPGTTRITLERGFEHQREDVELELIAGQTHDVKLTCDRLVDMEGLDWVSGDTHVHWVTNQWNVDEPLELLTLVQRAEDLRVANNLTLLQRYANSAFIKPSQAPMGPVTAFSDRYFHIQMGEEYRNENLYGHLCFLNIDWLVQPIGTGTIIAGPDALDYPLNRTAIEDCRRQGGISIEAHGTGGNKDVPVNVIHNLTDSLDQIEPDMYYRLLDCGFRLPLTNGSDHPARTLGIARAYVKVDGEFAYYRWIEGIRHGRTFTTSGPLLFLSVNDAEIGDVIESGPTEVLRITARAVSRDPVGLFQIISNGNVLAEKHLESSNGEIELTLPAGTSRWIVARCSNRAGERPKWGDFNAIAGPGVAHTSPIYVNVDGRPRFDPNAAQYWRERMRLHVNEVKAKGRFANQRQRQEAVGYLEQGIRMFGQLQSQIGTARRRDETFKATRARLENVLIRFGQNPVVRATLEELRAAGDDRELSAALEPLILLSVSVNPESRVKIDAHRDRVMLKQGRPQRFLIQVQNTAGITAPLNLSAIDLTTDPPSSADWCSIRVIDSPFTSKYFSGILEEFKVLEILSHAPGLREARIVGDAGQGTQDLGFRATADLMLDAAPKGIPYFAAPDDFTTQDE